MRHDAASPDGRVRIGVVVPFVETEVSRPPRSARGADHDLIEDRADQPLVVHVRAGNTRGHGHAAAIGEDVPLYAGFRAVRRIGAGMVPPVGALTIALSNAVQVH